MLSIWISILHHLHNRTIQQHNMPETDLQISDHVLPPYGLLMSHLWTCVLEKNNRPVKVKFLQTQRQPMASQHGFLVIHLVHGRRKGMASSLEGRYWKTPGTFGTITMSLWQQSPHKKKSMIISTNKGSMKISINSQGRLIGEYLSDFILPLRKPIVSFAHTTGHFCRAASGTNIF